MLRTWPIGAGALADAFNVPKPAMSAHFAVMVAVDLIAAEKSGHTTMYRLKMSLLEEAVMGYRLAYALAPIAIASKQAICLPAPAVVVVAGITAHCARMRRRARRGG